MRREVHQLSSALKNNRVNMTIVRFIVIGLRGMKLPFAHKACRWPQRAEAI